MKTFKITYFYIRKYETKIELEIEAENKEDAERIAKEIENSNELDYNLEKEVDGSEQCYLDSIEIEDKQDEISNT